MPYFIQDYPDAIEDLDSSFIHIFGPLLQTTILADADHVHDLSTRNSSTGLLGFVGSTPVFW